MQVPALCARWGRGLCAGLCQLRLWLLAASLAPFQQQEHPAV